MSGTHLVVWQLSDGKRGHERQVEGLLAGLARQRALDVHRIAVARTFVGHAANALARRFPAADGLPDPALVIAAGSACQAALLAARRARGGRSVYLMRPALPWRWFDAVVVPRHDDPPAAPNVIQSEGALNPVRPAAQRAAELGLVLLGGPSTHHAWDSAAIVQQIERRLARAPRRDWVVTDSRRSPPELAAALRGLERDGVRYVPAAECAPGWLPGELGRAAEVWVSADSVAMIYEALSGGGLVGVLDVPSKRRDRITRIAQALHARGWIMRGEEDAPASPPSALDEGGRVAALLLQRWPELGGAGGAP
ncbi:MAG: mitochondrial fission ELM1 family protein [Gammaproteobacteria bacterium]|nr:mitochondrial fission ELM1 family protein [Gammaproteobacteria bacterium]MCP5200568.1 mitochondrial fission ELM1 family protein [Gammaproteobacteria bacterium]